VYRTLLRAYPRRFRDAYAAEMVRVFRDCLRETQQRRGAIGVVGLWGPLLVDTASSALLERVSEGMRMSKLTWIRLGGAGAMLAGLAQIAYFVLATAIYFSGEHNLFVAYLYGWQISPPLALLFVLALAGLYLQFTRLPAGRSPSSLSLATAGVVLAGSGLLLITGRDRRRGVGGGRHPHLRQRHRDWRRKPPDFSRGMNAPLSS
jgi:hypothetical protein